MKSIRPITSALQQATLSQSTTTCRAACLTNTFTRPTTRKQQHQPQRRPFVSGAFTPNQTLTAQRTLRYPSSVIYDIISDVASYSQFVPFCQNSLVTKYSSPASDGKTYPEEAKLVIGFNDSISEEFTSRVYCVPGRAVEAVSGATESTLHGEEIAHHSPRPAAERDPSRKDTVMSHLLTRWTLKPYPYKPPPAGATHPDGVHKNHEETSPLPGQEKTDVNLVIEFQFANPLYAALSSAAAPKVADKMIESFVNRVEAVMDGPANARDAQKSSVLKKST
ncbi:hypothetical protein M409DRAFT_20857 [Zasmidium cellare ATCC 36951]|uniref:Coenzyme Q-binding protein COQ10 START domain-containing protein n=1 Tax=Zasmidium cellare ATCC 36951 TaxID=1080233 RepID=A0A6A6CSP1_ZASCE|nr:uncharacterized protein M409DRAFT_20857 [Zasmidium cellare ATCC 36951]KAF2168842.1 hypothetical protein M409DRAFT_20857 [Zasmidium cellare ATCC 36951]